MSGPFQLRPIYPAISIRGRAKGLYDRQENEKKEWNSDDEEVDEFGRKKKKRKTKTKGGGDAEGCEDAPPPGEDLLTQQASTTAANAAAATAALLLAASSFSATPASASSAAPPCFISSVAPLDPSLPLPLTSLRWAPTPGVSTVCQWSSDRLSMDLSALQAAAPPEFHSVSSPPGPENNNAAGLSTLLAAAVGKRPFDEAELSREPKWEPAPPVRCKFFAGGRCARGTSCQFRHDEELRPCPMEKKRARPCRFFEEGHCLSGKACPFAHGVDELAEIMKNKPLGADSRVNKAGLQNLIR